MEPLDAYERTVLIMLGFILKIVAYHLGGMTGAPFKPPTAGAVRSALHHANKLLGKRIL